MVYRTDNGFRTVRALRMIVGRVYTLTLILMTIYGLSLFYTQLTRTVQHSTIGRGAQLQLESAVYRGSAEEFERKPQWI